MRIFFRNWMVCWGFWVLPVLAFAQGVDFRKVSFEEALELAIKEKKQVFIDFHTEWCGPCKRMSREVFVREEAGRYFNREFICLKMDAEKGEGKELAQKYGVRAYPTFIVLDGEGREEYRTTGYRPAEEFIEKIRKGIDPQWSPKGLARRYEKGERSPGLINDYALLLLEQGQQERGEQVLRDYFHSLSPKKRIKPENFFLYSRYSFNLKDEKARYLFDHKDAFVKMNGREAVEKLLYAWLRIELIPYVTLHNVLPVTEEELQHLEDEIQQVGMMEAGNMPDLLAIAKIRIGGDLNRYLEICGERFPRLEQKDRLIILLDMDRLRNADSMVKMAGVQLIREHLDEVEGINQRVLRMKMLELQGLKDYSLRATIPAVEKGKVVVMGWSPQGMLRDTFAFQDHVVALDIARRDTLKVALKLLCDELGCPTPRLGTYYPNVDLMLVPGEFAVVDIVAEKGRVPQMVWKRGGEVAHDYHRLNYEQAAPAEWAYRQLVMDNIIRGGDIREYKTELEDYMAANQKIIVDFVRNNPKSYISVLNLLEHYNWFDENETERLYGQFPEQLKGTPAARYIKNKLDAGRAYRVGTPAPAFSKKDMNGKLITLEQWKGKYVLLDFWGSWCGPCRASHPHLRELYKKYGKRVVFIHVAHENERDLTEARKKWKQAVQEDGLTWTQILNNEEVEDCNLLKLFHINSFPTKVLIDPEGKVAARYVGAMADPAERLQQIFGY